MLIYLDSMICIYAVEGSEHFQSLAKAKLASLKGPTDRFAISDLVWLECRIAPLRDHATNPNRLEEMEQFLTAADITRVPLSTDVYERACRIRADDSKRYKLADALHLAAAIEGGCGIFLTFDKKLTHFTDINVETLT